MNHNPISDMVQFLVQPGWTTAVFWLLLLGSIAVAVHVYRTMPAQRGGASEGVVPKLMQLLIELRAEARTKKDFATGDKIRNTLAEAGIALEDRKGGATEWRIGGGP